MRKYVPMGFGVIMCQSVWAEVVTGIDDAAQLPFWELREDSLSLRLVQRLPDQTRAYFAGRGFSREDAGYVAQFCIFQTVFTNTAAAASRHVISYDLRDWRVLTKEKQLPLMLREDWRLIWRRRDAGQAPTIAFEWSLLPTQQSYQATDYNWGMTVYQLGHGEKFDLKLVWKLDGEPKSATLQGIRCAKDIDVPPKAQ